MKRMELCLITVMAGLTVPLNAATWRTDDFKVTVSESGQVIGLFDQLNSVDYAAKQQPSPLLQAHTIDRSLPRHISVWGTHFPNMPIPPIPGETCVGSKIALFGCAADHALDRIGRIELAEGLPHPVFDSIWSRKNPKLEIDSYILIEVAEQVKGGQMLICDGTKRLRIYDERGRQNKAVELSTAPPMIPTGKHDVHVECEFNGDPAPVVKVQLKSLDKGETVRIKQ